MTTPERELLREARGRIPFCELAAKIDALLAQPEQPSATVKPNILCHAPGERCTGCLHYQGKADICEWATLKPEQPSADYIAGLEKAAEICERERVAWGTSDGEDAVAGRDASINCAEAIRAHAKELGEGNASRSKD